jgi:hypothetical protein
LYYEHLNDFAFALRKIIIPAFDEKGRALKDQPHHSNDAYLKVNLFLARCKDFGNPTLTHKRSQLYFVPEMNEK